MTDTMRQENVADDGFRDLTEKITRESEFRCTSYKDKCVRRRIAVRMRARGTRTYAEYATVLDADRKEYDQLLDALTVNVTRFFRNPSAYAVVARHVVPDLWQRAGAIGVWSAGTASGEEAYSMAALFYEYARNLDELGHIGRVSVVGSDIDRVSLDAAHRAMYLPASFVDTTPELLDRLFPRLDEQRTVLPPIRAITRFEHRDLLQDPPPPEAFDLIACRNVVIYLDRASQEMLLDALFDSLRPGGYLVMGHVETLFGRARRHLVPIDVRERIYQKPL
ncbi:MAG TPA: protein-glutamate O-methyltransferase CheR [Gemmatimonadaceae bacterium]